MDVLVDAPLAGREPVVDGAELDEHAALDAGLLGHLARGGLRQGLLALDVALGQAPLDATGPVAPGDDGDAGLALVDVDDDTARAALLHRGQPPGRHPGRVCGGVAHLVTVTSGVPRHPGPRGGSVTRAERARAGPRQSQSAAGGRDPAYPWCSCPPPQPSPAPARGRRSPTWRPSCRCSPTSASGSRRPGTTSPSSAGPVRDAFLGRVATDLDFTTSARPDVTEAVLAAWGVDDVGHGPRVRHDRRPPGQHRRRGDDLPGRRLRRQTRKPVVAFGDTLEDDLVRRDFTVNAMALRLPDLAFVDPHGGLVDLEARSAAHARPRRRCPSATTRCG